MASVSVLTNRPVQTGELLFALVGDEGSATHPYFYGDSFTSGAESARNVADALHFLCALHGRFPGIIDHAAGRTFEPSSRVWLLRACEAIAIERQFLTRLSVAAGPAPSTPGSGAESAVVVQRHALTVLAQSERHGSALGAALALAADWLVIRRLLESASARLGVEAPESRLGDEGALKEVADAAGQSVAMERALLFGAQQLALQHRGLWDLLEARRQARLSY